MQIIKIRWQTFLRKNLKFTLKFLKLDGQHSYAQI